MDAVEGGHFDCVRALVEAGADLTVVTKGGHTVVCSAYTSHRGKILLYLLEIGAPMGMAFPGTKEQLLELARKDLEAGR